MSDEQITAAVQEGIRNGVSAVAAAMRSGNTTPPRTQKVTNPMTVAALVVAMTVPAGGLIGWNMSLSSRVAVLESQSISLQTAAQEIAALKQEVTDFRGEFREWKRDNHPGMNGKGQ